MTTPAIIGCRARGCCRLSRSCYGHRDIGAGTTAPMPFTKAIGVPKSAFTAAYLMASAITAPATRAAIGATAISFYNRTVNNISSVSITNVYNKTVVVNNTTNVSYNGGTGGTTARATPKQMPPPTSSMCRLRRRRRRTCKPLRKTRRFPSTTIRAIQPSQPLPTLQSLKVRG